VLRRYNRALTSVAAATLLAAGTWVGTALAREQTPPAPDKVALGEDEVKQLVLLMDHDKNGKVSETEFLSFMKAEFKRLDKDHSGELDVRELTDSQIRVSHFTAAGK
jgi:hypothetical protein